MTHYDRLKGTPSAYHIFLAMRIIEASQPDAPPLGQSRRPREEAVRFGQEPELAFPPTTIKDFEAATAGKRPTLVNRFFGFFGPHGPLPLHLTEYARERKLNHRDRTFVDFANMLSHRFTTLLFRAWTTGNPTAAHDGTTRDRFSRQVAALAGHYGSGLTDRDAMPDLAKRHYSGLLAAQPRGASGLAAILSDFAGVRVRVKEFIGSWLKLEPSDRWQLGQPAALGPDTMLGSSIWVRGAKFRLLIGPVGLEDYQRLLPSGPLIAPLTAIVRNYVPDPLDWDVNLILKAEEVPKPILGKSAILGLQGWIGERSTAGDADDLCFDPSAFAHTQQPQGGEMTHV